MLCLETGKVSNQSEVGREAAMFSTIALLFALRMICYALYSIHTTTHYSSAVTKCNPIAGEFCTERGLSSSWDDSPCVQSVAVHCRLTGPNQPAGVSIPLPG